MAHNYKFTPSIGTSSLIFKIDYEGRVVETWWKADDIPPRPEFNNLKVKELDLISNDGVLSFDKINNTLLSLLAEYRATLDEETRLEDAGSSNLEAEKVLHAKQSVIANQENRAAELLAACPVNSPFDAIRICHAIAHPDLTEIIGETVRDVCERALFVIERQERKAA